MTTYILNRLRVITWMLLPGFLLVSALNSAHAADPLPPVDTTGAYLFPYIEYCDGPTTVLINSEPLDLWMDHLLQPGDELETVSGQFVVLRFGKQEHIIIHPLSRVRFAEDGTQLTLLDAEIHVLNASGTSLLSGGVICFDTKVFHDSTGEAFEYGLMCRGEAGIALTGQKGDIVFDTPSERHLVHEGTAIVGRSESTRFMDVPQPDKPQILDTVNIKNRLANDSRTGIHLSWKPVPMSDHYLVHIYSPQEEQVSHRFRIRKDNTFSSEDLPPGSYKLRIMTVDFYGVSGNWSDPYSFHILPADDLPQD
ncbi:hypothetical protein QA596_03005 [Balneolales bacterium ANBcel1]|nr:hypothetical protein [Balneolales bacterium ANBcel1]